MTALPWHEGDRAVTADGWRAVVVCVTSDGRVIEWSEVSDWRNHDSWPADAVPDLSHVGTAASWLRSCAEVVGPWHPARAELHRKWLARLAVRDAYPEHAWTPHDPALVARAVEAVRAYLATLTGEKP